MFNHQKFNVKVGSESQPILLAEDFKDQLISSVFPTININEHLYAYDALHVDHQLTVGLISKVEFEAFMSSEVNGDVHTVFDMGNYTSLNTTISSNKNIYGSIDVELKLDSKIYSSKNLYLIGNLKDELISKVYTTKDIYPKITFSDLLGTSIMADIFDSDSTTVTISIPPNGVLEIDSGNYTVYLNDQNVFDSYSGNWIMLDRSTIELHLGVGNSRDISGNIVYREMYL